MEPSVTLRLPVESLIPALEFVLHAGARGAHGPTLYLGFEGDRTFRIESFQNQDHMVRTIPSTELAAPPWPSDLPRYWRVSPQILPILRAIKSSAGNRVLTLLFTKTSLRIGLDGSEELRVHLDLEPRGALRSRPPFEGTPATLHMAAFHQALAATGHAISYERDWSSLLYVRPVPEGTEFIGVRPHAAARVVIEDRLGTFQLPVTTVRRLLGLTAAPPLLERLAVGFVAVKEGEPRVLRFETRTAGLLETRAVELRPCPATEDLFANRYTCEAEVELGDLERALAFFERVSEPGPERSIYGLEFHATGVTVRHAVSGVTIARTIPALSPPCGAGNLRIHGETLLRALHARKRRGTLRYDPSTDRLALDAPSGVLIADTTVLASLREGPPRDG